ncbi:MAG TPA: M48 family metalloprotease [Candidatus Saccharimonadales bacterium]|nr:M48 family metalloprotease [Candidatus Saccharimonadales bacterium]
MYKEIAANKRKTIIIMMSFVVFITALGWLIGQYFGGRPSIFGGVLIGSIIYALISYFAASKMAVLMNGAHEVEKRDNPRLYRTVENIAITNGLPMPKVYIMDDPALNAFATGRNPSRSIVCATTGLLHTLNDKELEGVMAHEMGHIQNYDIRVSLVAFAMVAVIGIMADIIIRMAWFGGDDDDNSALFALGIVAAILAPIVATLIQLAISRKREFLADATGALTTRYPDGLASALEKIKTHGSATKRPNTATAHLFFANPLSKRQFANMFSTHPPLDERIKRLREMGKQA